MRVAGTGAGRAAARAVARVAEGWVAGKVEVAREGGSSGDGRGGGGRRERAKVCFSRWSCRVM